MARGSGPYAAGVRARLETGRCPRGHDYGDYSGGQCRECDRETKRLRHRVIGAAHRLLGLSQREYLRIYGESLAVARDVLAGDR